MAVVTVNGGWVELRPLTGHDESRVFEADLPNALSLIDGLLTDRQGTLAAPGGAARLSSSARDHLLAAIYREQYGDEVATTTTCAACRARYDLSFSLADLVRSLPAAPPAPDGPYRLEGFAFRLPTGEDELAVIGLPRDAMRRELLRRCLIEGELPGGDSFEPFAAALEAAMEAAGPLINLELDAQCPECGAAQSLHFDMQTYLLSALLADQRRLTAEIHLLAMTYRWGLSEILLLTRRQRQRYVALIDASNQAAARAVQPFTIGGRRRAT
ncbi:MAG: hypothetical protein IPK19_00840 [Chloroflexi bacterium]|nr:hypothetical protein [Chloroflexota bacterium]